MITLLRPQTPPGFEVTRRRVHGIPLGGHHDCGKAQGREPHQAVLRQPLESAPDISKAFDDYCATRGIRRSLGSYFATYKKELIHTRPWPHLDIVTQETFAWIEGYDNTIRRHSTLGCLA